MLKKLMERWHRSKLLAWLIKFVDEKPTAESNAKALRRTILLLLAFLAITAVVSVILLKSDLAILDPKGVIANHERNLIIFAALLALIIVIPTFILTFVTAWKYRENNHKAAYKPEFDKSNAVEAIWWGVPLAMILILSVVTWKSSHDLDPFKPLASKVKPLTVQVVAMEWKWLFIYPEQNVASLNWLELPVDTPVNFRITSDAPMNSFWIPRLGGQIYAMPGMSTKLHLMASEVGYYRGASANISGRGFASMDFTARVSSAADFEAWLARVRSTGLTLTTEDYAHLAKPSIDNAPELYSQVDATLYDKVIMQFMLPGQELRKLDGQYSAQGHEAEE